MLSQQRSPNRMVWISQQVNEKRKMAHDDDYLFALQLQKELDAEEESAATDVSKI